MAPSPSNVEVESMRNGRDKSRAVFIDDCNLPGRQASDAGLMDDIADSLHPDLMADIISDGAHGRRPTSLLFIEIIIIRIRLRELCFEAVVMGRGRAADLRLQLYALAPSTDPYYRLGTRKAKSGSRSMA